MLLRGRGVRVDGTYPGKLVKRGSGKPVEPPRIRERRTVGHVFLVEP